MYHLIQHAPIRWPQKDKHGIEVSRDARDLISKVSQSNSRRCSSRTGRKGLARKKTSTKFWVIPGSPTWTWKSCFKRRSLRLMFQRSRAKAIWVISTQKSRMSPWRSQFCQKSQSTEFWTKKMLSKTSDPFWSKNLTLKRGLLQIHLTTNEFQLQVEFTMTGISLLRV